MRKYFLTLEDVKKSEILEIFRLAKYFKKKRVINLLKDKTFFLFFEELSILTEISFNIAIQQLNGKIVSFSSRISKKHFKDILKVLEKYVDLFIFGVNEHKTLKLATEIVDTPIVNASSNLSNPCQALSDMFTIKERFKSLRGLKLAYIGIPDNICNSLLLACTKLGIDISIACPPRFKPNKDFINLARKYSKITKAEVKITKNPEKAAKDANVIYTTSSFGSKKGKKIPSRYKVTEKLFELANSDCVFMHSLPINRGEEVTSKVVDSFRSIIFEQAENKLYVLKAIFVEMLPETLIKLKLHL